MAKVKKSYFFRSPKLKMRKEKFGGLARADGPIYMLGRVEFSILLNFKGFETKTKAKKRFGGALLKKFTAVRFLLEIDRGVAENILKERR